MYFHTTRAIQCPQRHTHPHHTLLTHFPYEKRLIFLISASLHPDDADPCARPDAVVLVSSAAVSVVLKERRSKDSVTLAWQGPERPNGVIVEYEVIYYEKVSGTDARAHPYAFIEEKNLAGWRARPPSCLYGKQAGALVWKEV